MKKNIVISISCVLSVVILTNAGKENGTTDVAAKKVKPVVGNQKTSGFKESFPLLAIANDKLAMPGLTENNHKTKQPVLAPKDMVDNFFKKMSRKGLSVMEKIELIDVVFANEPSFWGRHQELYALIAAEQNKYIQGDLVDLFFSLYTRPYNGELPNPTAEQRADIVSLVKELIKNPFTMYQAVSRANILLTNDEIQRAYKELEHTLDKKGKRGLVNSYT